MYGDASTGRDKTKRNFIVCESGKTIGGVSDPSRGGGKACEGDNKSLEEIDRRERHATWKAEAEVLPSRGRCNS